MLLCIHRPLLTYSFTLSASAYHYPIAVEFVDVDSTSLASHRRCLCSYGTSSPISLFSIVPSIVSIVHLFLSFSHCLLTFPCVRIHVSRSTSTAMVIVYAVGVVRKGGASPFGLSSRSWVVRGTFRFVSLSLPVVRFVMSHSPSFVFPLRSLLSPLVRFPLPAAIPSSPSSSHFPSSVLPSLFVPSTH